MKKGLFGALAMLAFAAIPGLAEAATRGYATANVNMRSGPGTNYPAVVVIPNGATLTIHGCLREVPWCDVSFARGRGWVAGRYVQAIYRQNRVYVEPQYYESLGVPTIQFDVGTYWDRYYRDRDFYRERNTWRDRDRDRWRQPPPPVDNRWRDRDRRPDNDWSGRPDPNWDRRPDYDRRPDRRPDNNWDRRPDNNWDRGPDRRPDDRDRQPDRRPDNNWDRRPDDNRGNNRPDDRRPPPRPPVQEDTGRPQRLPSDDTWTRGLNGSGSSSDQRQDERRGPGGMDFNGNPCTDGSHGCIPSR